MARQRQEGGVELSDLAPSAVPSIQITKTGETTARTSLKNRAQDADIVLNDLGEIADEKSAASQNQPEDFSAEDAEDYGALPAFAKVPNPREAPKQVEIEDEYGNVRVSSPIKERAQEARNVLDFLAKRNEENKSAENASRNLPPQKEDASAEDFGALPAIPGIRIKTNEIETDASGHILSSREARENQEAAEKRALEEQNREEEKLRQLDASQSPVTSEQQNRIDQEAEAFGALPSARPKTTTAHILEIDQYAQLLRKHTAEEQAKKASDQTQQQQSHSQPVTPQFALRHLGLLPDNQHEPKSAQGAHLHHQQDSSAGTLTRNVQQKFRDRLISNTFQNSAAPKLQTKQDFIDYNLKVLMNDVFPEALPILKQFFINRDRRLFSTLTLLNAGMGVFDIKVAKKIQGAVIELMKDPSFSQYKPEEKLAVSKLASTLFNYIQLHEDENKSEQPHLGQQQR